MKPQRQWLLFVLVTLTIASVLGGAAPASATTSHGSSSEEGTLSPEERAPNSEDEPAGPLTNEPGEVGPQAQVPGSPAGCRGKINDPHRSSHVPGTVNVTASTTCDYNVESLFIRVTLWRSRWYGWQRIGGVDSGKRNYGWYKIDYHANSAQCGGETHDYQGRAYHESREPTGTYSLNTRKTKRFTC